MATTRPEAERRARRGLLVFALVTIVGSAIADVNLSKHPSWMIVVMWVPGLGSLFTRVVLREGFADISLRFDRRGWSLLAVAWLYPIVGSSMRAYPIRSP